MEKNNKKQISVDNKENTPLNNFKENLIKAKEFFLKLSLKRKITLILTLFLIVFGIVYLFRSGYNSFGSDNTTLKDFASFSHSNGVIESVVATKKVGNYLDIQTNFEIKTKEDMEVSELQNHVALMPAIDYKLEKTDTASFLLIPASGVPANSLINVVAVEEGNSLYKWAFETEKVLDIKSTYPYNEGSIGTAGVIEITLTYPDVTNFEECFEISGGVTGSFEKSGYTYRFIPDQSLEVAKTYYVTVKKGLTNGVHTLGADYQFSFQVYNDNYKLDEFDFTSINLDESLTFTPDEKPEIGIVFNQIDNNALINIEQAELSLFQVSREQYISSLNSKEFDESSLTVFDQATVKINKYNEATDNYQLAYVEYPNNLPIGYYIFKYKIGNVEKFQFIQISNIVAYVATTEKDVIAWINDYNTNNSVENAVVSFNGKSVFTKEDGVAIIKNIYDDGNDLVSISYDEEELLVKLSQFDDTYYNGIVYTDRPLYKTSDAIKVWGFIPPRNLAKNKNYYLKISDQTYPISVNSEGIFTTEINTTNAMNVIETIQLYYDDVQIANRSVQIRNYETPNYIYTISTDKEAYYENDPIKIDITIEHISGIKAVDKQLNVIYGDQNISCTTDTLGKCSVTLTATKDNYYYYSISNQDIRVRSSDAVDSDDLCHKTIIMINEKEEIKVTSSSSDDKFYINVLGNRLNIENGVLKIDNVLDSKVKLEIIENSYDIEKITAIDEYTKEKYTYEKYENRARTVIETKYYNINNGILTISDLEYPTIKTDKKYTYYEFNLSLENSRISTTLYYYLENHYKSQPVRSDYTTNCPNLLCRGTIFSYNMNYSYSYYFSNLNYKYSAGSKIDTTANNYLTQKTNEKKLVYLFTDEIMDYYFDSEEVEYKKEYVPGVNIAGATFDGTKNHMIQAAYLDYNEPDLDARVLLSTDKEIYSPKDSVNLDITVTDKEGNPISTNVLISVVNDGVFALNEDYLYLGGLFEDKYLGFYQFATYQDLLARHNYAGGAGASSIVNERTDFGDTIYFKTVKTDENGSAKITFQLNDSVTTFRITALSINSDLYNAFTNIKIKSQLPYFIENSSLDGFKNTDDFVVATNTLSNGKQNVNYQFKLNEQEYQAEGITNQYIYQNFGKLDSGNYRLQITSGDQNNKDSVGYDFIVKDYYNEIRIENNEYLKNGVQNVGLNSDTINIELYDQSLGFYLKLINNLTVIGGDRLDQYVAKKKGVDLYNKYNGTTLSANVSIPNKFIQENKLLLLENAEFSPLINALVVNYAPNMLSTTLISNLEEVTNQYLSEHEVTDIDYFDYLVLGAALKIISLEDLKLLEPLDIQDSIDLSLAFAFLGDYDNSIKIYTDKIKEDSNYKENKEIISVLLSMIDSSSCKDLLLELEDSANEYYTFAIISYLENSMPFIEDLTVTVNDEEYTLNKLSVKPFVFTKEEAKNLTITSTSNQVMIRKVFYGRPSEIDDTSKIYNVALKMDNDLVLNQVYELEVNISDIPKNRCGNFYLVLPRGLRYYSIGESYNYNSTLISNHSNSLTYSICTTDNNKVSFKIPVVTTLEGNYILESSVYNHNTYYGVSPEMILNIHK